jgi:homoserine kinase type II
MTLAEAQQALRSYDLDIASVQALDAGSVNSNFDARARDGTRFFLRVYEEQDLEGATRELQVIRELASAGVPTPAPVPRRGGGFVSQHAGKPLGVHPWVNGESLCFRMLTPALVRQVGRALGRVHQTSASLSHIPAGRFGLDGLERRLALVDRSDASYAPHTRRIREKLAFYAARSPRDLPSGLIHGDLFRDNVLWERTPEGGFRLSALLDFESASSGVFIYDLMVCAHAWCYGAGYDPELVRALLSGYREERPLSHDERAALPFQGALAALRFATTRLTDFSLRAAPGQEPKRDFRRFLARLDALESGVLSAIFDEGRS